MSNALTTAARPLALDPSAKAVLMALCDMAREPDDRDRPCEAWPPMHGQDGAVGLCDWTCLKERAVQLAVKRLASDGMIARRQLRHGVVYTVLLLTPAFNTGVPSTGVADTGVPDALTPAPDAPKALQSTTKRKKTTSSPSRRPAASRDYPMPDGVDPDHWRDFLANRKRKRLPNTTSAHKSLMDDLARHTTDAWPVPRLIAYAAGKGWASVRNPEGEDRNGRIVDRSRGAAPSVRGSRPDPALDMLYAARRAEEAERAGGDWESDSGAWPALPSHGGD